DWFDPGAVADGVRADRTPLRRHFPREPLPERDPHPPLQLLLDPHGGRCHELAALVVHEEDRAGVDLEHRADPLEQRREQLLELEGRQRGVGDQLQPLQPVGMGEEPFVHDPDVPRVGVRETTDPCVAGAPRRPFRVMRHTARATRFATVPTVGHLAGAARLIGAAALGVATALVVASCGGGGGSAAGTRTGGPPSLPTVPSSTRTATAAATETSADAETTTSEPADTPTVTVTETETAPTVTETAPATTVTLTETQTVTAPEAP